MSPLETPAAGRLLRPGTARPWVSPERPQPRPAPTTLSQARSALAAQASVITNLVVELARARDTDALTGALNHPGWHRAVSSHPAPLHDDIAVVFIDVDDFKEVNDHHGHAAGDRVLITLAGRLTAAYGSDRIARRSGDEFLAFVSGVEDPEVLVGQVERVCVVPLVDEHGSEVLTVTATAGVAWFSELEPEAVTRPEALDVLVDLADARMATRKQERSPVGSRTGGAVISDQRGHGVRCQAQDLSQISVGRALGV